MTRRVVIAGGGPAGVRCAMALRTGGFDGRISVLARESFVPYDRTLVSKGLLDRLPVADDVLLLHPLPAYAEADVELLLGTAAVGLDVARQRVRTNAGRELSYDALVIATGADAATPPGIATDVVHRLRDRADALQLHARLAESEHVVIVGGGFLATEVASAVAARGAQATIVTSDIAPLAAHLGVEAAARLATVYRSHGVAVMPGVRAAKVIARSGTATVLTADGRRITADTVVVAAGMRPTTGWLRDTVLTSGGAVRVDAHCRTVVPGVFAAGDCAQVVGSSDLGGHWDHAARQGRRVAAGILGRHAEDARAPYFWSDQFDLKLQVVGRPAWADACEVEDDDSPHRFAVRYTCRETIVGVLAVGWPARIAAARRELHAPREVPAWA